MEYTPELKRLGLGDELPGGPQRRGAVGSEFTRWAHTRGLLVGEKEDLGVSVFDPQRIEGAEHLVKSAYSLEDFLKQRLSDKRGHVSVRVYPVSLLQAELYVSAVLHIPLSRVQVAATTVGLDCLLGTTGEALRLRIATLPKIGPGDALRLSTPRGFVWPSPTVPRVTSIWCLRDTKEELTELGRLSGLPLGALGAGIAALGLGRSQGLPVDSKSTISGDAGWFTRCVKEALRP